MYTRRPVAPLTIDTNSNERKPGVFTTATFRYTEEPITSKTQRQASVRRANSRQQSVGAAAAGRSRTSPQRIAVSTYPGSTASPPGMYVRALYDYDADDQTSLSFRQGDLIQVLNRLDSGWWDGIINDVRGWFPSNYCTMLDGSDGAEGGLPVVLGDDISGDSGTDDDYDEYQKDRVTNGDQKSGGVVPQFAEPDDEEAAFWIPQATPDGKLYYFNTLTGKSKMELPLENITSGTETGPFDRLNIRAPYQTRAPPEMTAGGFPRDEDNDTASASDAEDPMSTSRGSLPQRRRSYISEGASPRASVDSSDASPVTHSRNGSPDFQSPLQTSASRSATAVAAASFTGISSGQFSNMAIPRSFFDDGTTPPVTWNRLVDNMRRSVESYRRAINNADRSEYVRKAEDISDHLRMLLAAGSGTTDNHSGNPSIISTNKPLYPHFRDMMSRFSKLVLTSHIAAADWPSADAYSKCLQEAEGVMNGVYGYVEVARSQREEDIPRLVPGFVLGSHIGGNWKNNNIGTRDLMSSTQFMDQDEFEPSVELSARLDPSLLERLDKLKRMIVSAIRQLDEHLVVPEKTITPSRHEQLSNTICSCAGKLIEYFRPYISTVEEIDLSPLRSTFQNSQLVDFGTLKQILYDLIANFLIACQTVAGPLSDEWADTRGEPLENRVQHVRDIAKQLESSVAQLGYSLHLMFENLPRQESSNKTRDVAFRDGQRQTEDDSTYDRTIGQRSDQAESTPYVSRPEGMDPMGPNYASNQEKKLAKFFGVPTAIPYFLRLDHEGEISYDQRSNPPILRGGTLTALVEQLTRHDRFDSQFNSTFLLTYRSFTTAPELFVMLVKRFSIQPPPGISQADYQIWQDSKQKPIRLRVVNILKCWFDSFWMENYDEASCELLRRVYSFAQDSVATTNTPGAGPLKQVIEQRLKGQESSNKRMVQTINTNTAVPIIPRNMKKLKFLDIDVTEFARQLTIIESRLYGKIKPAECLNRTWPGGKKSHAEDESSPNIRALILHSNQLTNWVAEMILTQADVKKRVVVIKHFVAVADKCRQLNNFSTVTAIMSALGTAPIHRLNRTWAQVNARTSAALDSMRKLMESTKNFAEYRETLHSANPPCIPFFGVYLTDLTFIEDGIPSVIKRTNLINFAKRVKTAEVIREIQQYQNKPYPLQPVPELQDYILTNLQAAGDVHEMYDKSLAVEPREREDEKIARLLSESGFL